MKKDWRKEIFIATNESLTDKIEVIAAWKVEELEQKHKKEKREAIDEAVDAGSGGDLYVSDHTRDKIRLKKKFNCEEVRI